MTFILRRLTPQTDKGKLLHAFSFTFISPSTGSKFSLRKSEAWVETWTPRYLKGINPFQRAEGEVALAAWSIGNKVDFNQLTRRPVTAENVFRTDNAP